MARTHSYHLGGADREFRFTMRERREMESRFGLGLAQLIQEQILAIGADKRPSLNGKYEPTLALVYLGLRHYGKGVTEQRVEDWLSREVELKGHYMEPVSTACLAVFASGVLGYRHEEPEGDAGKAEPPAEEPPQS